MTSTNDQKMRVVAEKLRMLGNTMPSPWELPYRLPSPPNFLEPAGADALMTRFGAEGITVQEIAQYNKDAWLVELETSAIRRMGYGPNWREALLDAAYKLLGENVDGRH